jgi:branched-chain amino acid transport system ATP-binding protein
MSNESSLLQAGLRPPLLESTGLNAWYGTSHVIRGVDLVIREGETVALMGRNGMGKSTLLRSVLGHVRYRTGCVRIGGVDMSTARAHAIARRGLSYVPEGRGVFANLSVRENLLLAGQPGVDGKRAWTFERVLDTFPRLKVRLSNGGAQLSGGEQQMLAIGRALMTNPICLILDEATEGLAPKIAQEIWQVISSVRATGITAIIVDRNYHTVLEHADRAIVLEKGQIVVEASGANLLADSALQHRYLGI